jgi:xanthine/uracil permease
MGMIPVISNQFFQSLPKALTPLLHSGILLATITAVVLNAYFNGLRSDKGGCAGKSCR